MFGEGLGIARLSNLVIFSRDTTFIGLFADSFIQSFVYSLIHYIYDALIRSFIHPFIHLFVHSFNCCNTGPISLCCRLCVTKINVIFVILYESTGGLVVVIPPFDAMVVGSNSVTLKILIQNLVYIVNRYSQTVKKNIGRKPACC